MLHSFPVTALLEYNTVTTLLEYLNDVSSGIVLIAADPILISL